MTITRSNLGGFVWPRLTIPNWVPPLASADDLNSQNEIDATQRNVIAKDSVLPIILGQAQVGGKIFAVDYNESTETWTVGVAWCVGQCQSIVATYANGAAFSGTDQNNYLGTTTQTADPLLSAAISGYTDTLVISRPGGDIGVCYSVFEYTDDDYPDFPTFIAEIQGLKTNSGSYSVSPARALGYLIEHPVIGLGATADATTLGTVASDNAAVVSSESRREIGLVIDQPQPASAWLRILATYASCWINRVSNTYYFTSDRPRSADFTLDEDDVEDSTLAIQGSGKKQAPTVVEVLYTDTSEDIWRQEAAVSEDPGVSSGSTPRIVSRVRMPGVTRYSQAVREAVERRKKLALQSPSISFDGFDSLMGAQLGDVINLTHAPFSGQNFRLSAPPRKTLGGPVQIIASKYDASVYDNSELTSPTYGARPAPAVGPGVTSIATYFQSTPPSSNLDIGSIWFDTDDNNAPYRWNGSSWVSTRDGTIQDAQDDATQALADAANAQADADGKVTTFYNATPPTPEGTGDLWFDTDDDALYRWNGTSWIGIQDADIAQAIADAATAQSTADGKIVTYAQTTPPTAEGVGDLWVETDDDDELHRWNGASWVSVRDGTISNAQADATQALADAATASAAAGSAQTDATQALADAAAAQSTADGKITTFYNATPPTAEGIGDLWLDTDDNSLARWNGTTWVGIQDDDIAQAISDAATAQSTADGKIVTFAQTSTPTAEGVGDLWVDTDDNNQTYRWNGAAWVDIRDPVAYWEAIEDSTEMPQVIPPGIRVGGSTNIAFNENKLANGSANDGEIQVTAGTFRLPDGTTRVLTAAVAVYTPFEGAISLPYDGNFYVVWGAAAAHTRFGGVANDYGNSDGLFSAHYNRATGTWYACDNTNRYKATFTPASTDFVMCVGTKQSSPVGIATLSTLIGNSGALALDDLVTQSLVADGAVVAGVHSNSYSGSFTSIPPSSISGTANQVSIPTFQTPADLTDTIITLDFTFAVRCNMTYTGDSASDIAKYVQIYWDLYQFGQNGSASGTNESLYVRCVKDTTGAGNTYKGFGYFHLSLPLDLSGLSTSTNYTLGLKVRYNDGDSNLVPSVIQISHRSGRAIILNKSKPVVSGGWSM